MYITKSLSAIASAIHADKLTQGAIILHLGSRIQLISQPQDTTRGIMFDALWLDLDSTSNTQQCFHNNSLFEYEAYRGEFDSPLASLVSQVPVFDTWLAA